MTYWMLTIAKVFTTQANSLKPSLASAVIDSLPTVKEFIDRIIKESEEIMAQFIDWGMMHFPAQCEDPVENNPG